jgi:hypothetical protein
MNNKKNVMNLNKKVIKRLESVIIEDTDTLHEVENMCRDINDLNIIRPIFMVFENNPNFNFGNPGDLIRIVEKFHKYPEYENELYTSIKRMPTEYNLWMLNRLLNTFDDEKKEIGIELFKAVLNNSEVPVNVRDWAKEFLDEQTG